MSYNMKNKHKIEQFVNKYFYVISAIILLLAIFNLFYKLGTATVQDWDEARHGVTAYEMIKNNNYIITTYGFNVDYYNLKPPLGMFLIAMCYKIFGYSIFAMRVVSPVSSIITIILVGKILKDKVSKMAAVVGMTALTTNFLFITWHAGRTGDVDSIFTMIFTLIMYLLIKSEKDIRFFYLAGLSYAVAFLIKSYATLQIIAVVGLSLICTGRLFKLKLKELLIFLFCSFAPIIVWMGIRFKYDGTKFLTKMITYDVLARSTSTIENQKGSIAYYLIYSISYNFHWVLYIAIILIAYFIINKSNFKLYENKFFKISIIIWAVLPFILFSLSKSKLVWYINPIYPAVSIIIGIVSYNIYENAYVCKGLGKVILILFFACALFGEGRIIKKIYSDKMPANQDILMSLKDKVKAKNVDIYYSEQWGQANMFIVEVIDGMNPKVESKEAYVNNKSKGLYLLDNNKLDMEFVEKNKLKIVCKNEDYIIVK